MSIALVMDPAASVAQEAAEAEFNRFVETMDLDVDKAGMDDEEKTEFEALKRKVVRAIISKRLVIDEKGQPVFTPTSGQPVITFAEPRGKAIQASDLKKEGHNVKKMFAAMADFTSQPEAVFMNMLHRDLRVCLALAKLFLA